MQRHTSVFALIAAFFAVSCASPKVLVPPRIDLARYGTLGMIEFTAKGPHGLAKTATSQFMAVVQGAQPGVPILELGDARRVLAAVGHDDIDPEAIKAIGEKYGVDAILVGELETHQPRPNFSINSLVESVKAGADIEGVLSARMYQTRSGATIWTNAARGKQSVANVSFSRGAIPRIGGKDPATAEARLVHSLVGTLAADFQPRWERQ